MKYKSKEGQESLIRKTLGSGRNCTKQKTCATRKMNLISLRFEYLILYKYSLPPLIFFIILYFILLALFISLDSLSTPSDLGIGRFVRETPHLTLPLC